MSDLRYSLSLFSVIFGFNGLIITLVWPSFSKTAVIFIDHVFINPGIYKILKMVRALTLVDKCI